MCSWRYPGSVSFWKSSSCLFTIIWKGWVYAFSSWQMNLMKSDENCHVMMARCKVHIMTLNIILYISSSYYSGTLLPTMLSYVCMYVWREPRVGLGREKKKKKASRREWWKALFQEMVRYKQTTRCVARQRTFILSLWNDNKKIPVHFRFLSTLMLSYISIRRIFSYTTLNVVYYLNFQIYLLNSCYNKIPLIFFYL